ncbi:MAG: AAA family ATPase [Candidatus Omnitrophota bacterium]|nr:MAG: AAA family ATPase [Candidatus Omnitrophota bacterium]
MYLKELEIFGFKSFPQKTTLKFEPGVIIVVGPNGCGKSNILDSIKWALGEQRPKSLRGSKMEDVIFGGTEHYPPLNYTEVTLTFSNEDKYLPIDYREVSVTRRLYRSGESQYFINKSAVRLKDIEDIFMGTGVGESMYSFVEQGRIEIFLGYRPEEKRIIFDEAAGIIKYKERKKEALRRLEETEDNLLRLEDILSEVRRQIRYLERQVDRARKYRELDTKLLGVEKKIASLQIAGLEEKSNRFLEELNRLKEEDQKKDIYLQEAKRDWDSLNTQIKNLRKSLEEANAEIISLSAHIETHTTHIAVLEQREAELGERNRNIEDAKVSLYQRLEVQEGRIQEENVQLSSFEVRMSELALSVENLKEKEQLLKAQIQEARRIIDEEKGKILEWESQRTNSHNALIELQANLSSLLKRKQRLLLDKGKLEGFLTESKENLAGTTADFERIDKNLQQLRERKNNLSLQEKELSVKKEDLKDRLIEKEKELVELNSNYEFLKDLRIKYETFSFKKKVTVIFDEDPKDINKFVASLKDVEFKKEGGVYSASLEVKIISLEEHQLEERINAVRAAIEDTRTRLQLLERQRAEFAQKVILEVDQIKEKEKNYRTTLQEKERLENEWARLNEEFQLVGREVETILGEIADLERNQKDMEEKLLLCEESLNKAQENLKSNQERVSAHSEEINNIGIELAKKEEQKVSLHKEKDAFVSKMNLLQEEKSNLTSNIETIEQEKDENGARITTLGQEIAQLRVKIEEYKRNIQEYTEKKKIYETEEGALGERIEGNRESLKALEEETQQIKASIYNKKLEIQSVDYEKTKIKDYLQQVYHVEFEPLPEEAIEGTIETFLGEKEKLQKKKESLGEVNLVAIEEFEELKKREEFLQAQKQDLVISKENLKKAIQKINRTSTELFLETFAKIEEEFKKNFKFLFGGGRAQLILLDKSNILESGVEIEVQPPGKKLQNVSLLSGGEKALTAIALIFAIFKVRPSPLCVLDEIDAPLDEANVDRFNHLLKQFTAASQFIVITHNKKTMSNATCLYGVTMEEKGVSKLVSVKFATQEAASQ